MSNDDYARGYEDGLLAKQSEIDRLLKERGRLQRENRELMDLLDESVRYHAELAREIEELRKLGTSLFKPTTSTLSA